jgi:hypothetical protein
VAAASGRSALWLCPMPAVLAVLSRDWSARLLSFPSYPGTDFERLDRGNGNNLQQSGGLHYHLHGVGPAGAQGGGGLLRRPNQRDQLPQRCRHEGKTFPTSPARLSVTRNAARRVQGQRVCVLCGLRARTLALRRSAARAARAQHPTPAPPPPPGNPRVTIDAVLPAPAWGAEPDAARGRGVGYGVLRRGPGCGVLWLGPRHPGTRRGAVLGAYYLCGFALAFGCRGAVSAGAIVWLVCALFFGDPVGLRVCVCVACFFCSCLLVLGGFVVC